MSYPGSKGADGVWQRIIGQMPAHEVYWEPFCGDAKVFKAKLPARLNYLTDLNAAAVARVGVSAGVIAMVGDAFTWLPILAAAVPLDKRAVVYVDPPYMLSTRKGRRYYDHELTDDQHALLLTLLQALKCHVLISHVPCDFYLERLQGWRCITYRTRTRGKTVLENLWCNFPEPEQLHDWRYCGRNHRQRTSLKRLAARWLAKLEAMAPRQRGYVLNAIAQRQSRRASTSDIATPELTGRSAPPDLALQDPLPPGLALVDRTMQQTGPNGKTQPCHA